MARAIYEQTESRASGNFANDSELPLIRKKESRASGDFANDSELPFMRKKESRASGDFANDSELPLSQNLSTIYTKKQLTFSATNDTIILQGLQIRRIFEKRGISK